MHSIKLSKDKFKVLGITITKEESVSEENSFRPKLKAMEAILRQWLGRKLSLKGKINHEFFGHVTNYLSCNFLDTQQYIAWN